MIDSAAIAWRMTPIWQSPENADLYHGLLAILRNTKVRAVLLDRRLPDRDGVDVLREIVKNPDHPPVILVSGAASIESAREAGSLGAVGYLEKPVRIADILAVVDKVSASRQHKVDAVGTDTNHQSTNLIASMSATGRLAEVVLRASLQSIDFRNAQGLAKAVNVGHGTMRHWCRIAQVSGRAFVRFTRGFWATRSAVRAVQTPIEILDCLEIETSQRILDPVPRLEAAVEIYCTHQKHLPASHPVVLACLKLLLRSASSTDIRETTPTTKHQKVPNLRRSS